MEDGDAGIGEGAAEGAMSLARGPGMGAENPPIPSSLLVLHLCEQYRLLGYAGGTEENHSLQ